MITLLQWPQQKQWSFEQKSKLPLLALMHILPKGIEWSNRLNPIFAFKMEVFDLVQTKHRKCIPHVKKDEDCTQIHERSWLVLDFTINVENSFLPIMWFLKASMSSLVSDQSNTLSKQTQCYEYLLIYLFNLNRDSPLDQTPRASCLKMIFLPWDDHRCFLRTKALPFMLRRSG